MAYVWLYCVLLSNALIIFAAEESCPTTLSLCKLQIGGDSPLKLPSKGPKGTKGDIGDAGQKGEPGNVGPKGLTGTGGLSGTAGIPGIQGPKGQQGLKGNYGDAGPSGDPGPTGSLGSKGERGDRGIQGSNGIPGPTGDQGMDEISGLPGPRGPDGYTAKKGVKGVPGRIGPPGSPGNPGICMCQRNDTDVADDGLYDDYGDEPNIYFGTKKKPANVVCKFASESIINNTYYLGPGPMTVSCFTRNDLTTLTCIPPRNASEIEIDEQRHWLSQKNFTIEDMYGINRAQIEWLQKYSASAFQTVRFHCLNINPFPRDKVENSLLLLSWNENAIGPMPTLTKPFFYSIVADGCSDATDDEWSYTDIKLVSESIRRVPVIDFYMADIRRGKTQAVKIEHLELCFD